jgi:hypothetical protein
MPLIRAIPRGTIALGDVLGERVMVTTRSKTVTITGPAGFAIVRGLTERLERLNRRLKALEHDDTPAGQELRTYYTHQISGCHAAFAAFNAADFTITQALAA